MTYVNQDTLGNVPAQTSLSDSPPNNGADAPVPDSQSHGVITVQLGKRIPTVPTIGIGLAGA